MPLFKRCESMSLIIAYVGKKGCVMAGDKRRIAYFGSKEERELLEQEIYTGEITNDEELYARAEELEISLKITDDATKVKSLENVKRECVTLMFTKTNFHYIVIKQVTCSHVYFYDPLFLFVRKMKKDRFLKKWSKICLFYIKI